MSSTSSKTLVTQVKLDLKNVIDSLRLLENATETDEQQLNAAKEKTQKLLRHLENQSLEKLNKKLQKQRKRRLLKKSKKKNIKVSSRCPENHRQYAVSRLDVNTDHQKPSQPSHKQHHQLRALHECQRFLKTFELLEQLHLARGQDPAETNKFASKLQHLKTIWNSLLQEHQGAEQCNDEHQIHHQWNEVLFGKEEKSYYVGKQNLKYFIRKRQIWDSYINNKQGSSIPIGWVLPPKEANDEWSQYLTKE